MTYLGEFLLVAGAHLLAVASPGPDFTIVVHQSVRRGRTVAIATALGIGTGIFVHVGYSLLGLGVLVASSQTWFDAVKYAGAAYLVWLGGKSLAARPWGGFSPDPAGAQPEQAGFWKGFTTGFLVNILNPKAALFFIALFATVIDPRTPRLIQGLYGVWMALATMLWFCMVAVFFTRPAVRCAFLRFGVWFDRLMGVLLIGLAVRLASASLR